LGGFLIDLKSDYLPPAAESVAGAAAVVSTGAAAVVSTAAGASMVVESVAVASVVSSVLPPPQEVMKAVRARIANTFFILSFVLV
jgi:hypothetical protein